MTFAPFVTGTLTENGTESGSLRGRGFQGDFILAPPVGERAYLGFKLAYRRSSYSSLITTGNVSRDVSYSDSDIFPAFVFGWRMD